MRRLLALAFLTAVAVPAWAPRPAAAQVTPRGDSDSAVVRLHGFNYFYGPGQVRVESFQRGRLGILVDLSADAARDSIGARVAGLTPESPAGKAGVQVGDLVVRFNGTPLVRRASRGGGDDEEQSRPGVRLLRLASQLNPGDTVRLDLRRAGRALSVSLVAQESGADEVVRGFDFGMPRGDRDFGFKVPGFDNFVFSGGPLANMELVQVNPGLADYFGTSDGLLVVNVGNDSILGLRAGDVILAIGGRKPGSPAHAMRILGTYEANETVTFDVMRMKHRTSVTGRMPEERRGSWNVEPNSFEFGPTTTFPRGWSQDDELPRTLLRLPFTPGKVATVRAET
jgi:membrane-associated protease RseP (regulator of RpoE activity)